MSSYYCNCHQPYFLSIDTYNTKHDIQNNNIQEKKLFKTITLFCIPFYTLHTPTEPNKTTKICNCRSVAPGLIFGWTTQKLQFLVFLLKSCYLRRTKNCGSFRLNYHIFEHNLYIYLIPENFQDILNYRYHHFIFLWFSFKLHQISQLTIN